MCVCHSPKKGSQTKGRTAESFYVVQLGLQGTEFLVLFAHHNMYFNMRQGPQMGGGYVKHQGSLHVGILRSGRVKFS